MQRVVIYGQSSKNEYLTLKKMRDYSFAIPIKIVGEIIDFYGSSDGLEIISEEINEIDIIFIFNKEGIDQFNWEFINQLITSHGVEIKFYN